MSMRTIAMARHSVTFRNLRSIRNAFTGWRYYHMQYIRAQEKSKSESMQAQLRDANVNIKARLKSERENKAAFVIQYNLFRRWKFQKESLLQGRSLRLFLEHALNTEKAKRNKIVSSLE